MKSSNQTSETILHLTHWAEHQASVRAMLLTSSRANPNASVDVFSDYDVILVVQDIHPFFEDRSWLQDFGEVLIAYWDPIHPAPGFGIEKVANVIQYTDGLKLDFNLWPVELMRQIIRSRMLPDNLNIGFTILVDKDRLTEGMQAPNYKAFIPRPPTEEEFQKVIEDFYSDVPYVAKCLWRDELMPAKWCLDYDMKHNFLRQMLEWRMEIDYEWSVPTGNLGKGLKKLLSPIIWSELEKTYVGAGMEENWEALFITISLFHDVGIEVAQRLGYTYPHELDQGVTAYIKKMKNIS